MAHGSPARAPGPPRGRGRGVGGVGVGVAIIYTRFYVLDIIQECRFLPLHQPPSWGTRANLLEHKVFEMRSLLVLVELFEFCSGRR